ncbi:MAG: DUF1566 domain-containing protein [Gammaproteobacteria bacterium]
MSAVFRKAATIEQWLKVAVVAALLTGCGGGGGDEPPAGNSPAPSGPSEEPPSEEPPGAETPSEEGTDEPPDEETPEEESPAEEPPMEEPPGEESPAFTAPEGLALTAGHGSVTATWDPVAGAEGYHLYYAEEPDVTPENYAAYAGGVWLQDVTSPHTVEGLTHGATYYFIVTAYANGEETPPSTTRAITLPGKIENAKTGALNDSGVVFCADATEAELDCVLAAYPNQDAQSGRDAEARAGKLGKLGDGAAGFDFLKISHAGIPLPPDAALGPAESDWACTLDNVTGLLWEIGPDEPGSLRDRTSTYSWYSTDSATNGGYEGVADNGVCSLSDCNTQAYVEAVNAVGLCGFHDWRLPTAGELASIVHHGRTTPAIDTNYFPDVPADGTPYWTSTPFAADATTAWGIDFMDGVLLYAGKAARFRVRLVRADD